MSTVHASPEYAILPLGDPPPRYPQRRDEGSFATSPDRLAFAGRRVEYLDHCRRNPAPANTKAVYYELARLAAGGQPHEGILQSALDFIDARRDCADFVLHSILRLLYQFSSHRQPGFSQEALERARRTTLGFKYWPDEPGRDSLCTWTENHQILFASAAYLAGQLYPDETFGNSRHTGQQKMELNRPRILRWLELRYKTGFSEWLSHVYYDEDMTALLSLVDFCRDGEIVRKAEMVLDLLLLDLALNSYRGVFGSSHGRSYVNTKQLASNEGTTDTSRLLFGMGVYSAFDNMSAPTFALSPRYRVPPVLAAIAADVEHTPMMANRQRMGIRLAQAGRWGLQFDNFEDGMRLLSLEAYAHPRTIALTMRMFDAFNWWENEFFAPFQPYRRLLTWLRRLGLLGQLARVLERDVCRNTREEVNLYTCRTPDYMLSCAQDYRKGYGGDQQHIWQATLGPDAVCFTTHPARLEGASPNYWTGSGLLPRAAQVGNVVIALYRLEKIPALYVPTELFFTHAWLPAERFDELVERQGWYFARKGKGYLALRSQQPARWGSALPADPAREGVEEELIADGPENIWICELGREADSGSFADFMTAICAAEVEFGSLRVRYRSPSQGWLEFGWRGDLRQDGQPVPLEEYPRYENPYVRADFPAGEIVVRHGGQELLLDWENGTRRVSGGGLE